MTCQERDTDLLLYKLRELTPSKHWGIGLHLLTCKRCKQRQEELASVSSQIASVLRPPSNIPGTRPQASVGSSLPIFSILVILIVMVLLGVFLTPIISSHFRTASHAIQSDEGCKPGLPNDKCK